MKNIISRVLIISSLISLTACGGGGSSDGGNNSQALTEARTISGNTVHGDTATEAYTLEFTAVDAAASSSFTLYLWDLQFLTNQATVTQAAIDVHIYPDGGTGETCSLVWANGLATCQFTSLNNTAQLNLDITNNSGADISYSYIFLPGTTPDDGSIASPFRIADSVIYDTYISVTAGIVGGISGDSSYYVVNTGSAGTTFDSAIIAVAGGNNSSLALELFSESTYTTSVFACADLSACGTIYGLTANTDYYLKITNNGSASSDWIVYQLDLTPSNNVPFDYGIQVSLAVGGSAADQPYSIYMFDSSGVAVAGLWSDNVMTAGGTLNTKLKTLDSNGCVTTTDAVQITTGTYTFVNSFADSNYLPRTDVIDKPAACAGSAGYISSALQGGYQSIDMSSVTISLGVNLADDTGLTHGLLMDVDSTSTASQIICNVYESNYSGTDDKNRLGTFTKSLTTGLATFNTRSDLRLSAGNYRLYCIADVDANGTESSGDKVFDSSLTVTQTSNGSDQVIDATSGWTSVP